MPKDAFDFTDDYEDEDESKRTPADSSGMVWNILTIVMLVIAVCVGGTYLMILTNPQSGLNPFPPPTMPVVVIIPTNTPTATPKQLLPPTWTPTPSLAPTETATPEPTYTQAPPGQEPTATMIPGEGMPFVMQEGNPQYIPNIYHPDAGCNWLGVGGQVIGLNGGPVLYLSIKMGGSLNGQMVDLVTVSGTAPQYGQAGFEFKLADAPANSTQALWVQLLDQADLPLSEKIYFDTYEDCEKNLILINFKQVR